MKILVGFDDAEVSWEALVVAIIHAKAFNDKIYAFTSIMGGPNVPKMDFVAAEKNLKRAKEHVEKNGIECDTKLSVGGLEPGEDIVQYAKENEVDEIVVGVKRRSKVGNWFLVPMPSM